MKILSLDFGCKTGWGCQDGDRIESGVQEFSLGRGESPGMRFLRFNSWLDAMFAYVKPDLCIYEMAHHRGGFATDLLVGMTTRLQEKCAREGVEYATVHSSSLKKAMAGSGRAGKEDMIKAAKRLFPGRTIADDNEADALLLLSYAKGLYGKQK